MPAPDLRAPALKTFFERVCFIAAAGLWPALTFSQALSEIFFVTALVSWIFWKFPDFRLRISRTTLILLGALAAWTALTLLWTEAPKPSFKGCIRMFKHVLLFLILADVLPRASRLEKWEKVFLFTFLITALNGCAQKIIGFDLIRHIQPQDSGAGMRLSSSFKTYGLFASYLVISIPVIFGLLMSGRKFSRTWYFLLLLLPLGLFLLFMTRSRGAALAFLTGVFFLLLVRRRFFWIVSGFIIMLVGLAALPRGMVIHLDAELKEQSIVERFYLWDRAAHVIKAKPFTGTGINTYAVTHQKYDKTQSWRVKNYYAHNGYLQTAAETGIPGLLIFLALLFSILLQTRKVTGGVRSAAPDLAWKILGTGIAALNFLVFAMVDTVLHNPGAVLGFWYILGVHQACLISSQNSLEPRLQTGYPNPFTGKD